MKLSLQEKTFDAGHAMPRGLDKLANLIPDMPQLNAAARLLRGLLHPNPECRPTIDQVLSDEFLLGI